MEPENRKGLEMPGKGREKDCLQEGERASEGDGAQRHLVFVSLV